MLTKKYVIITLPITRSALAKNMNFNRSYLYRVFKALYGVSPGEYLLNLRIEKAKQLLCDKGLKLTIEDIGYAVGINDASYFSKLFNRKTGLSPTEFKRMKNEKDKEK